MKRSSQGRPAGSCCCSLARQEKNAAKGLEAERARMTRNDPLVLAKNTKQTKGLEFGPSPKQKGREVKEENFCEKGDSTNTTTTTQQPSPCEKGPTTTTNTTTNKEEDPCEKGDSTNTTTQ